MFLWVMSIYLVNLLDIKNATQLGGVNKRQKIGCHFPGKIHHQTLKIFGIESRPREKKMECSNFQVGSRNIFEFQNLKFMETLRKSAPSKGPFEETRSPFIEEMFEEPRLTQYQCYQTYYP
jgi:hypothetical protein